jgi:hypothetical protein
MTTLMQKEVAKAAKEFGFDSKDAFISLAVKEKILELKKMKFFALSEKIRTGLLERKESPEHILKQIRS